MSKPQDLGSALIQLLGSGTLALLVVALVADVIAADARFNYWFANEGKRSLSEGAIMESIDKYEDLTIRCHAAIEAFATTRDLQTFSSVFEGALEELRSRPST